MFGRPEIAPMPNTVPEFRQFTRLLLVTSIEVRSATSTLASGICFKMG